MFATLINCIDGRVQEASIAHVKKLSKCDYIDNITEAGIVKHLNKNGDCKALKHILEKIRISVDIHGSKYMAIAAHPDCAGNPVDDDIQKKQLVEAKEFLAGKFPGINIETIWIPENKKIQSL